MERLTTKSEITELPTLRALCESCGEDSCADVCAEACDTHVDNECIGCPVQDGISRLSAYEDTGLTPEEIAELAKRRHDCKIECLLEDYERVKQERDDLQSTLDMYGGEDGITAAFEKAAERDALARMVESYGAKADEAKRDCDAMDAQFEKMTRKLGAAVQDMQIMALAMRESEELTDECCFACICDAQNLPDNCILPYGECPGYETDDCFKWRGVQEGGAV